jgi:hypothetical protein
MLAIHSIFRWIVVIVGVIVAVKFLISWLQKKPFTSTDRTLALIFSITVDIQILLGLLTLLTVPITRQVLEHAFIMILALVAVHLTVRWRNAPDELRFRNTLLSFAAALVLIFIGVAVLPDGWTRPLPLILLP